MGNTKNMLYINTLTKFLFKDTIFLDYRYQIMYLTGGHADKDIFTKTYGVKEGFEGFLKKAILKKRLQQRENGTWKICHSTQSLN